MRRGQGAVASDDGFAALSRSQAIEYIFKRRAVYRGRARFLPSRLRRAARESRNGSGLRLWQVSFLFLRRPVDHPRQRRVRLRYHYFVDQKPHPVGSYGIGRNNMGQNRPGAELEERDRCADIEALAASHLHGHQLPVSRVVEQLTPIPPPAWNSATSGRYLPLATAIRAALHPDFTLARYNRDVAQPSPVARERPATFPSCHPERPERLPLVTPGHRQDPHIHYRLRVGFPIDDEAPVPRPVSGNFGVTRFQQQSLLSCEACRLLIEIENPTIPRGGPDDVAPVRRPDGI